MATVPVRARDDLELLERSLSWTRGVLVEVSDDLAGAATPCAGWTLLDLLRHMVDSLSALAEASTGSVALASFDFKSPNPVTTTLPTVRSPRSSRGRVSEEAMSSSVPWSAASRFSV